MQPTTTERLPLDSCQVSMARMPASIINIMVSYLSSNAQKLLLIGLFPQKNLEYYDEKSKKINDSLKRTVEYFLEFSDFQKAAHSARLLIDIIKTGIKNPALIEYILHYALDQLNGSYSQLRLMQTNSCGMNTVADLPGGARYERAKRDTLLFFKFVTLPRLSYWVESPGVPLSLKHKYRDCTTDAQSALDWKPAIDKSEKESSRSRITNCTVS